MFTFHQKPRSIIMPWHLEKGKNKPQLSAAFISLSLIKAKSLISSVLSLTYKLYLCTVPVGLDFSASFFKGLLNCLFVKLLHHLENILQDWRAQVKAKWKATVLFLSSTFVATVCGSLIVIVSLVPFLLVHLSIICVQQWQGAAFLFLLGCVELVAQTPIRALWTVGLVQVQSWGLGWWQAGHEDVLLALGALQKHTVAHF